jgi:ATP-binding cassette, subfamily B, bacterial MsbA
MRTRDLRRRIGLVTQRTVMFDDTIVNNILYGSPRATREQAIEAAKKAYADEFILEKTPDGYDSVLGNLGIRLSGGQMQRIALARAFLRDPDIMILDEATSQIDLESECLIHEALAKFLKGRTAIMVTHRPTTLALADRVAIIENGEVTDQGAPNEIQDRNSFYRSLCGTSELRAA